MTQVQILRKKLFETTLIMGYVDVLEEKLPSAITTNCFGCSVDHPSQIQHDVCMMMTMEEKVDFCWSQLIEDLDHDDIFARWVSGLPTNITGTEIKYFQSSEYREKQWFPQQEPKVKELLKKSSQKNKFCCLCLR